MNTPIARVLSLLVFFTTAAALADDKGKVVLVVNTAKNGEPKWNFHKYLVGKDGQAIEAAREQ